MSIIKCLYGSFLYWEEKINTAGRIARNWVKRYKAFGGDVFDNVFKGNPNTHLLFHSDGVFQYTSPAFINMFREQRMPQSMSRVRCYIDNAPIEANN